MSTMTNEARRKAIAGALGAHGSSAGYAHARYAQAFFEVGPPRQLAGCKGWVIERTIPNCHARDAMGCYPLFCCRHWTKLAEDLTALRGQYVSIVLVTDPFGPLGQSQLREIFDHVLAFKEHFVARLADPLESIVSRKRYQAARKALERLTIEVIDPPSRALGDWMPLYSESVRRHKVQRLKVLSQGRWRKCSTFPAPSYSERRSTKRPWECTSSTSRTNMCTVIWLPIARLDAASTSRRRFICGK